MKLLAQIYAGLLIALVANQINAAVIQNNKATPLNVAVIGAGASGLCSAKYCLEHGYNVTVFEQTEQIGGIWYYSEATSRDKNGAHVYSPMYQNLRTNVPHEIMEYPDYPYPENTSTFPTQPEVLDYLHSYADNFGLKKHIKLSREVVRAVPIANDKWEVIVKNMRTKKFDTYIFDAIFVCNGHYAMPFIPQIDGAEDFQGKMMHSRDYRKATTFRNKSVLVIGAASSGLDLTVQLSETADRVTLSRHKIRNETAEARDHRLRVFPPAVTQKDDVVRFTPTGAEFVDNSSQMFDVVIFATGYNYSFPFLSYDCGIYRNNNVIEPLYKQIINVEHPTMVFIGAPMFTATTRMFDLQVRYAMEFLSGAKKLPTKSEMMKDIQSRMTKKRPYALAAEQIEYINQLSKEGEIEGVPEVYVTIGAEAQGYRVIEPFLFRNFEYTVIDKNHFRKDKLVE